MKNVFFLLCTLFLLHCSDVIVPDISEEEVNLLAPVNNTTLIGQSVYFSWDHLPDAIDYQIEVVSPSFDSIVYWVIDSFTAQRSLELDLIPQSYQWRVRAYNDAYVSACCQQEWLFTLHNDSTLNLSELEVSLTSPIDGLFLNNNSVDFSWETLDVATAYSFELSEDVTFNNLLTSQYSNEHTITVELPTENTYYWRVRGENNLSNTFTDWQSRSFTLDQSAPSSPTLISPLHNDTLKIAEQNPDLSWSSATDSVIDSLFIYTDQNQTEQFMLAMLLENEFEFDTMVTTLDTGDYYWKVRSYDVAGNASDFSESRKFIIE